MKIVHESVNPNFTLIEKVTFAPKAKEGEKRLILPEDRYFKHAYGKCLNGEKKDKIVMFLTYDVIELPKADIVLIPSQHILCEVVCEDWEEAIQPSKIQVATEPWINLNA